MTRDIGGILVLAGALLVGGAGASTQEHPGAGGTVPDYSSFILTPKAPDTPRINGAKVFGVRPGHPFLFDEMDELAHHRRRYTRRELGDKLRAAGFEVRFLSHFMALLVPLLVVLRAVGRLLPGRLARAQERRDSELRVVPGVNGLFRGLLRLERLWLRVSSLPFGSSIVALARRPPATS